MRAVVIGLVTFAWLTLATAQPASAATINQCGTLDALQRPNPPQVERSGSVTISGKTYLLSSALSNNNTNTISPSATVGSSVCLSGELVAGTANLVNNYVLSVQPAPVSGLPSTATAPGPDARPLILGLSVVLAIAAFAARRSRVHRSG